MEFAIMRSVEMTRKQLKEMLIWEGVFYSKLYYGVIIKPGECNFICYRNHNA